RRLRYCASSSLASIAADQPRHDANHGTRECLWGRIRGQLAKFSGSGRKLPDQPQSTAAGKQALRPDPAAPFSLHGELAAWEPSPRCSAMDLNSHVTDGVPQAGNGGRVWRLPADL